MKNPMFIIGAIVVGGLLLLSSTVSAWNGNSGGRGWMMGPGYYNNTYYSGSANYNGQGYGTGYYDNTYYSDSANYNGQGYGRGMMRGWNGPNGGQNVGNRNYNNHGGGWGCW